MNILLVDDDPLSRKSLSKFLRSYLYHDVTEAENGQIAFDLLETQSFSLVISDIKMPILDGVELLKKIKESEFKNLDVILITGFGELQSAISALRMGAFDYLQKPVNVKELAAIVEKSDEHQKLLQENEKLKNEVSACESSITETKGLLNQYQKAYTEIFGLGQIGIFSAEMQRISELARTYHEHREAPVLVFGETGTGKEVVARMIHCKESEDLRPFITVNCSAITPSLFESELFGYETGAFTGARQQGQIGKLELAQGGTIFLDEIGDLPMDMQPKLLRAIQMREMYRIGGKKLINLDVRFICATNRNLEEMIKKGLFRQDLFYRLTTGQINILPLRQRKDEIIALAQMFLLHFACQKKKKFRIISSEAVKILYNHSWPGNVRELQNTIERVVLLNDSIEVLPQHLSFLPVTANIASDMKKLEIELPEEHYDYLELEKDILLQIMQKFNGNKSKVADYLGITRNRLNRKIEN